MRTKTKATKGQGRTVEAREITALLARELGRAWAHVRRRHPEIPDAVVLVAPGRDGRMRKWGHWSASRWSVDGKKRGEVLIAGELFGPSGGNHPELAPEARAVGVILHEAAHALADAREIQDTSRGGRYHNARYKALAEELGLVCEASEYGMANTKPTDTTLELYARELEALRQVLHGYREPEPDETSRARRRRGGDAGDDAGDEEGDDEDGEKTSGYSIACVCGCPQPRKIRLFSSVLERGPIACLLCEETFEPVR